LAAQSSSYHLEFDDRILRLPHQLLTLVNDSEKPIEAFESSQRCHKGRFYSGNDDSFDILDHLQGDIQATDGSVPPRSRVLETGERWRTVVAFSPENRACHIQVKAVLFSDGSFDGEDAAVQGLKAQRDGLAAGIHYWADKIRREKPDGSTLDVLLAEVRQRMVEDKMKQRKYPIDIRLEDPPPLLWQYWSGRLAVERNMEFQLLLTKHLSQDKASEYLRNVADAINQWGKKIDGNFALQKLNIVFPAIYQSADRG
jgi:hypothetical protein